MRELRPHLLHQEILFQLARVLGPSSICGSHGSGAIVFLKVVHLEALQDNGSLDLLKVNQLVFSESAWPRVREVLAGLPHSQHTLARQRRVLLYSATGNEGPVAELPDAP